MLFYFGFIFTYIIGVYFAFYLNIYFNFKSEAIKNECMRTILFIIYFVRCHESVECNKRERIYIYICLLIRVLQSNGMCLFIMLS